jgi:hypothetical protein
VHVREGPPDPDGGALRPRAGITPEPGPAAPAAASRHAAATAPGSKHAASAAAFGSKYAASAGRDTSAATPPATTSGRRRAVGVPAIIAGATRSYVGGRWVAERLAQVR